MLWELFILFLKIGSLSFGGGYAVITLIQREVTEKGWIKPEQFQDIVALAGMAPGSIATNTATLIGYSQMGILGGIISTIGIILPYSCYSHPLCSFFSPRTKQSLGPIFVLWTASNHYRTYHLCCDPLWNWRA